jgi:UDP-glucose 4-epimerase
MKCFVTWCAGFIGSHLTDRLLALGHEVVGYDNFSTGLEPFLEQAFSLPSFQFIYGDLLNTLALTAAMKSCDMVFHLAANADVRFGTEHPRKDLEQNTIATFNVLEAMRANQIKRIMFSSTGSVYGEAEVFPTPETAPFPTQTSLYGASKLACESLISAYCEGFGFQSYIFRFVSILGERYTHGHVLDFYQQLLKDPAHLYILGDGHQRKSYLYIHDCIDAIFLCLEKAQDKVNLFNLGTDEYCEVNNSAGWISEALGVTPAFAYSGGTKGWIGDNPFIFLDCNKIRALGWRPKLNIRQGVEATVRFFQQQSWVLEARA